MGKRDKIKRVFKGSSKSTWASASASTTSSIALTTTLEPRLDEPTDNAIKSSVTSNESQDAAPVRDLWNLAIKKLSKEDKSAILTIGLDSKLDILQHLTTEVIDKQTDFEAKRWKFDFNGRQIIPRDVFQKILFAMEKFKQVGDLAVNVDPIHASLPWAGVRFLLEVAMVESQQMGALLTGVERTSLLIGSCQIYEDLFLNVEQPEEKWKPAMVNLASALVALYAAMLSFLASAIRIYNQNPVSRTLRVILNPAEVIGFLDKCQVLENNLAIEVNNCERIQTRQVQTTSDERMQKLRQILVDLQTPILRIDSRVAAVCEKLEKSERLTILEWISSIRYEENHFFACEGRTDGTGQWLLNHARYREWRASSASMILWLHGDPGVGKTKLVSTVVDDLSKSLKKNPNDEALAYFYCDRNQSDRQDPTSILSSFVRQLSASRNDTIPRSTVQLYNQKKETGFASGSLKLEESQTVLADLFQIFPQITLVVDALDECEKKPRSRFVGILDRLIAESSMPVKVFFSSRRDRDIKHRFEVGPNLEIKAIDNQDDISMFVKQEIAASEKFWQGDISLEVKELIYNTLVEKSEGMFQWVALQIATLRELSCERDIRNRLGKLPESLKTTYDELYDKIQSQKESTPIIANRAFQWVMCSGRPLSPAELVAAVCQNPETDEIDKIYINMNFILSACQNLLTIDRELNVCRFSHLSVQEYLETHHWSSREPDCLVAKVCLLLLINGPAAPQQDEQPTNKEGEASSAHDIFEYACLNWATHVQRLEEKEDVENRLTTLLKHFLGSMDESSLAYRNWHGRMINYVQDSTRSRSFYGLPLCQVYDRFSPCSRASLAIVTFGFQKTILDWWTDCFAFINQKNTHGDSLLQIGALRGSVSIAENLLKMGADINASGGKYGSALKAASARGFEPMVELLLDKGADINESRGAHGSALQVASLSGHKSVVQLLLNKGADINMTGGNHGSALQAASFSNHESVVQLLLNKEADVNATSGDHGSALQAASYSGHESMVRLLLSKGANINAEGGAYGSALQAASYSDHESVVQLLLDEGADINVSGGYYGSALQVASYSGNESMMQLLLDNRADVNVLGGYHGSALQAASFSGHETVVQLLLDKRADVNALGGDHGSALQAASYHGSKSIVQLLLNNGADVNPEGGKYGSALMIASCMRNKTDKAVVQLLLKNEADVSASGGRYGSALQAASYSLDKSVVQLLLDNGADVNASGGEYGSALQAASYSGDESVVRLLLDNKADVNASGGRFGSALQAASFGCFEPIVQLLRDNRADINATGGEFGSALQAASYSGSESVVQILLDEGADVNVLGGKYGSALIAASYKRKQAVVQLLLNHEADVNASGGEFGSALQAASYSGVESVVQLLLDNGADVNASGGVHGSALIVASVRGNKAVVQLLLNNEADVNATGGKYGSALQAAAHHGSESISMSMVQLLLDKGADVNARGAACGTALKAASDRGNEAVIQLLQAAMGP